jgi:hypothetical protein
MPVGSQGMWKYVDSPVENLKRRRFKTLNCKARAAHPSWRTCGQVAAAAAVGSLSPSESRNFSDDDETNDNRTASSSL